MDRGSDVEGVLALTTLHGRFPSMRLAVPRSALRWSHGDGLVLRGLSELTVILGSQGEMLRGLGGWCLSRRGQLGVEIGGYRPTKFGRFRVLRG